MTRRTATLAEVRKSYKEAGHTVRIDREGHIEFKRNGEGHWLEGRWVSEYQTEEAYEENGTKFAAQTLLR